MSYLVIGVVLLAIAAVMMFLARPKDGKHVPFLADSRVATGYALVVTCVFALGLGSVVLSFGG
ncbi:MAG: hypothetical protein U1E56_13340 [Bauldia sp.]